MFAEAVPAVMGRAELELEAANINSTANTETGQDGTARVREPLLGKRGHKGHSPWWHLPVVTSPFHTNKSSTGKGQDREHKT